jgi:hypothetical protein
MVYSGHKGDVLSSGEIPARGIAGDVRLENVNSCDTENPDGSEGSENVTPL